MRLIDGDALMEHVYRDRLDNRELIAEMVRNAPTIEPERKKGWWTPVTNGRGGHCCNRCNGYAPSYMNGDEHLSDFCPHCGAYMGGEQDGSD